MPQITPDYYDEDYFLHGPETGKSGYGPYPPADSWIHRAVAELLHTLYPGIGPESFVVDIGGAFGYHLAELRKLTACYSMLVDCSKYTIKNCADVPGMLACCADVGQQVPLASCMANLIFSFETFEHVEEPRVPYMVGEIVRVLKPGAPLFATIATTEADRAVWGANPPTEHLCRKPRAWWEELLKFSGLEPDADTMKRALEYRTPDNRKLLVRGMRWDVFAYRKPQ